VRVVFVMKHCAYSRCADEFEPLTTWQRFCCDGCRTRHNQQKPRKQPAPKLESSIEDYLVAQVKRLGGEVRKVKWIGRDGAPDRLVMLPRSWGVKPGGVMFNEGSPAIWVELKRPGGKATFPKNPHERKQAREHERMRKMGQRVEVIDSFEGVDALLGG
jgi:hypothetical protein